MNVAIASLFLPSGCKTSLGYQVHYIANQMVERGHSVTVFSRNGREEDALYSLQAVHSIGGPGEFSFSWDLRSVDFSGFDVIHSHGNDWFLWGCERPRHIHTFHGSYFAESLREPQTKEKLRLLALAACQTASSVLCDTAIADSESTRIFLPGIRQVILNGVDLRVFTPRQQKIKWASDSFCGDALGKKKRRLAGSNLSGRDSPQAARCKVMDGVRRKGGRTRGAMVRPSLLTPAGGALSEGLGVLFARLECEHRTFKHRGDGIWNGGCRHSK